MAGLTSLLDIFDLSTPTADPTVLPTVIPTVTRAVVRTVVRTRVPTPTHTGAVHTIPTTAHIPVTTVPTDVPTTIISNISTTPTIEQLNNGFHQPVLFMMDFLPWSTIIMVMAFGFLILAGLYYFFGNLEDDRDDWLE